MAVQPNMSKAMVEAIARGELKNLLLSEKPSVLGSNLSSARDVIGGVHRWAFDMMLKMGTVVTPLNESASVYVETGPLRLGGVNNLADFLMTAKIAVQGNALKVIPASVVIAGGFPTIVALAGTTFFGALVRISNSPTNANYQRFPLQLAYGPGLATFLNFVILPMKNVVDLITLFPSNNAGMGLIQGISNATITIPTNAGQAGSVLSVETLNQRDL